MTNLRMLLNELAKAEAELADLTSAHARLEARIDELRRETATARNCATEHVNSPITSAATPATATVPTTAADKVSLFRSLFRGRPDVFARLWVDRKKGTKGYAAATSSVYIRFSRTIPVGYSR